MNLSKGDAVSDRGRPLEPKWPDGADCVTPVPHMSTTDGAPQTNPNPPTRFTLRGGEGTCPFSLDCCPVRVRQVPSQVSVTEPPNPPTPSPLCVSGTFVFNKVGNLGVVRCPHRTDPLLLASRQRERGPRPPPAVAETLHALHLTTRRRERVDRKGRAPPPPAPPPWRRGRGHVLLPLKFPHEGRADQAAHRPQLVHRGYVKSHPPLQKVPV